MDAGGLAEGRRGMAGVDLRRAFACFPSGVTALCALIEGRPVGMAASSFTPVSLSPPLASICIQNGSSTWQRLMHVPRLGVSVLVAHQEAGCRQLAARTGDRFAGLAWHSNKAGAVFIDGAALSLDCSIDQLIPAGDHKVVLLRIEALEIGPEASPLVFHASRYRRLEA